MTLGSYTYGTVARVEALAGDVVASRTFGTGTTPTLAQVETLLDDIASEMHMAMAAAGYTIPTSAEVTANAPRAAGWLALTNSYGACALVMQSLPYEAQTAALPDAPPSRGNWFRKRYEDGLKQIKGGVLATLGLSQSTAVSELPYAGQRLDDDGNVKLPLFTRGMSDYPGSRELTETE